MARKYDLRARAERQQATRRRIVEATAELHRTVGPARTEISAVAELAGVERVTVYRHFPQLESLLTACSQHFRDQHPLPDVAQYRAIRDPRQRAAAALDATFAYWEANQQMVANVLRDSAVLPVGGGFLAFQAAMAEVLRSGWNVRGRRRERLHAALRLAVDFHAWQRLARDQGLHREDCVAVMLGMLDGAVAASARG